jgi:hypothetical protein
MMKYATIIPVLRILFITLSVSALVAAQQPVAELGTWPHGAFTLLVGLWLAGRVMMNDDFDTVLPICARPAAHMIPGLKKFLWVEELMGTSIRSPVLSSRQIPSRLYQGPASSMTADRTGLWE